MRFCGVEGGDLRLKLQWLFRITLALLGALALASCFARASGALDPQNPIVVENALPGTPTGWSEGDWGGDRLEAFADVTSALPGDRVGLRVSTKPAGLPYQIEVFRLGWYGGAGARRVACLPDPGCAGSEDGIAQPAPTVDSLGTVRASNWTETDSFAVGDDWVSGYYVVRLRLLDGTARATVPLLVRAPATRARVILVQASVSTWQAYNPWGGKSLYDENSQGGRAHAVSFDRPYDKLDWSVFDHEVQLVRFLEREGYDVAYQTGMDTDRDPSSLAGYKIVISSGHDEYWSKQQRDAFEAARDAGTSLMFLGANTGYWQVRYEDGGRTMVGYKDAALDPTTDPALDTVQFRDLVPERPECRLLGVQYQGGTLTSADWGNWRTYDVADEALSDPWFANTGFAAGDTVPAIVGHEWDALLPGCASPAARVLFRYEGGSTKETAHATRYVAPSGARVFAAGTVNWNWTLDDFRKGGHTGSADPRVQQLMRNVLADLSQPAAPQNYPPIATPVASTLAPLTEQTVTLTDSSADQDGTIVSRAWDLDGDGQFDDGTGSTATVSYPTTGTHTVTLRVTDDDGAVSTASLHLVVSQGSEYASAVLSDVPTTYWRLGETSGTTAADLVGTAKGTYLNGVALNQPGALGGDASRAVFLDGVDDSVRVSDVSAIDPTSALTIEAWIKPEQFGSTADPPMEIARKTSQYELSLTSNDRLAFAVWKNGIRTTVVTSAIDSIEPGTWTHVVGSWDGTTATVYVNGAAANSAALAAPIDPGQSFPLFLGSAGGSSNFFHGQLDEVSFYAKALSPAQVDAHFRAANDVSPPIVELLSPAGGSTMNATPTFGGHAGLQRGDLDAVRVDVYAGAAATGTPVATLQTQRHSGGSFSVVGGSLGAGTYTATATQSDASGNTGVSAPVTFSVDPSLTPSLVVAGDVADCKDVGDEGTAALLDGLPGTVGITGDTVYDSGTPTEYDKCFDPSWGRHLARIRPGVGDHEYETPGATGYFQYFGAAAGDPTKGYYSYDIGSAWHVVVLNAQCGFVSGGCLAGSPEEQWLRADLAASSKLCTVAILDEPRFSSGRALNDPDSLLMTDFWKALYDYNAELVISGDDHIYERFLPQTPDGKRDLARGIREFVVGTGGAQPTSIVKVWQNSEIRQSGTFGVLDLTLRSTGYDWEFRPVAGQTFTDSGSESCHGDVADTTPPVVSLSEPADGSSSTNAVPTFQGAAGTASGDLPTVTVKVYSGGSASGSPVETLTTSASGGGWSVAASPALAVGTYTAQASQSDSAGNTGTSAANTFTIAASGPTYRDSIMADAPAGYWRLGETSGTVAANQVSGAAAGTYAGGVTLGIGGALRSDSDTAVRFGGTNGSVSIPSYAALNGTGGLTLELWVRRDRAKRDEVLLSKGAGSYELAFTKPDFIEFRIAGSSRIAISTVKVSDTTTWHHIVVTMTGTSVAIYLDGQDVTGKVTARKLAASAAPLRVGSDGTSFFGGGVDELAVYGTALAPARVRAHFAAAG